MDDMKRLITLAVVTLASHAIVSFAGEPVVSSKQVVPVPGPPPPPASFFRGNEFDIGAFGTYATGTGNNPTGTRVRDGISTTLSGETTVSGWGGGMDFSYYFPWKYAGVRFQGAGLSLSTGTFTVTETVNGVRTASRTGSVSTSAGIITSNIVLRLPLDDFWPGVHLAPYVFGGFGVLFAGGNGETINTRFPELNARFNNASSSVQSRPLGNIGGGFEYRFTPHIGLFGEAGYNVVDHNGRGSTNFVQTNFGLRFAF
jgi:hypothetical protein